MFHRFKNVHIFLVLLDSPREELLGDLNPSDGDSSGKKYMIQAEVARLNYVNYPFNCTAANTDTVASLSNAAGHYEVYDTFF